nr:MAG TPA: resistance protein [Caudoviricetes sp.]
MKLFEIDERLAACVKISDDQAVDTVTGEVIDIEAVEALEMEREQKIENIGLWIKELTAQAEAIKAEKNKLAEREKSAKSKAERLKEFLTAYLGGKKFETAKVAIKFRSVESVSVPDVAMLPAEYIRTKITNEADKTAIKNVIKAGEVVAGAELVKKQSISVN